MPTPFSAPFNRSAPPCLLLVYRLKRIISSDLLRFIDRAKRLEGRSGRDDLVLLLHELLAGGLNGNCETELSRVLLNDVSN
jgi:hypothetical protein